MDQVSKISVNLAALKLMNLPIVNHDLYTFDKLIEDFQLSYFDIDESQFNKTKFIVYEIYDNPHDSDESSYRYLVQFEGKPNCIMGYTGDRGTFYCKFFSKNEGIKLHAYFSSIMTLSLNFEVLEEDEDLSDSYTVPGIIDGHLYYHIRSPKNAGINTKKPLYRLEDDESITPLEFVRFKTKKQSWEEKEGDRFIIAKIDNKEVEVPYYRLITKQSL